DLAAAGTGTDRHRPAAADRLGLLRKTRRAAGLALDRRRVAGAAGARDPDRPGAVRVGRDHARQQRGQRDRARHARGIELHVRLRRRGGASVRAAPGGGRAADHRIPDPAADHRLLRDLRAVVAPRHPGVDRARAVLGAGAQLEGQRRRGPERGRQPVPRRGRSPVGRARLLRPHEPARAVRGDGPGHVQHFGGAADPLRADAVAHRARRGRPHDLGLAHLASRRDPHRAADGAGRRRHRRRRRRAGSPIRRRHRRDHSRHDGRGAAVPGGDRRHHRHLRAGLAGRSSAGGAAAARRRAADGQAGLRLAVRAADVGDRRAVGTGAGRGRPDGDQGDPQRICRLSRNGGAPRRHVRSARQTDRHLRAVRRRQPRQRGPAGVDDRHAGARAAGRGGRAGHEELGRGELRVDDDGRIHRARDADL
ncbi:MAG: Na+ dependent nucleoside transporter precursor, partial [uncultured Sphingomonadaceae bacterium]